MTTPLPPDDPLVPDDTLPGEAELAALYRQLPRREPGPALDAAVLRAAADALGAGERPPRVERRQAPRESGDWVHPRPLSAVTARTIPVLDGAARRRGVPHWVVALGSAASLLLVAGLAWHMRTIPTVSAPAEPAPQTQKAAFAADASADAAPAAAPTFSAPAALRLSRAPVPTPARLAGQARAPSAPLHAAIPPPPAAPQAKALAQPPAPARLAARSPMPAPAPPPAADVLQETAPVQAANLAPPAEQLARIEQLFAHGNEREAQRRLLDFHRAYPRWPLSPELRAKLPTP